MNMRELFENMKLLVPIFSFQSLNKLSKTKYVFIRITPTSIMSYDLINTVESHDNGRFIFENIMNKQIICEYFKTHDIYGNLSPTDHIWVAMKQSDNGLTALKNKEFLKVQIQLTQNQLNFLTNKLKTYGNSDY